MATNYPTSLDTYSVKVDNVDNVVAQHVNDLQDAVEAIEETVGLGGWSTFTPTVTQGVAVTSTASYARYKVVNKICHMEIRLSITSAGSAGSNIVIASIPATAQPVHTFAGLFPLGLATVFDSGTAAYIGNVNDNSAASSFIIRDTNTRGVIGTNPSFALASGDSIVLNCTYEVA